MERLPRLEGVDVERVPTAKEAKALEEEAKPSETPPPVIRKIDTEGVDPDLQRLRFPVTLRGERSNAPGKG